MSQADVIRTWLERDGDGATLGELGLALHFSRRDWRGHESTVRRTVVRLLKFAIHLQSPLCDSVDFWVAYAEANLLAWRDTGAGRHYLRAALHGWNRAQEVGESMQPSWLTERAKVLVYCGDYAAGTMQLGTILDTTEQFVDRRSTVLKVAMIYQHGLKHHAQAIALIYRLAMGGTMRLLSSADLLFLLARAYECWGHALEAEAKSDVRDQLDDETVASREKMLRDAEIALETSQGMFRKLHDSLLSNKETADLTAYDVNAWLNNAKTWHLLGDKCSYAGFELFAADLYEEGVRRNAHCGRSLWFRLAKVQWLCGRDQLARDALRCARESSHPSQQPQLDALANAWDVDQQFDPASEQIDDLVTIKELIAALPVENDERSRAATKISSRARGNIIRQRVHETDAEVRVPTRTIVDIGVNAHSPFEIVDKETIGARPVFGESVINSQAPAPAPPDERTVELSLLKEERAHLSRRVEDASEALEAAKAAFQAVVVEQQARGEQMTPRHNDACEKMSQTSLEADLADECVSSIDSHSSHRPTCSVATKDTLRLEIDLMCVQKERDELVSRLQSTIEQAMVAEARLRDDLAAKCADQARAARELFEKMLAEAQRETQTARDRLSASEKLLDTARVDSHLRSKVTAARRRADGEVVFARAIKSHLMVRIVWKLPNCFEIEAIDASDGSSYKLVVSDLDLAPGQVRETAAQLAERLYVNRNNELALLGEPTPSDIPVQVSDLGNQSVARVVLEERRKQIYIRDEAIVSCRSASLAFRALLYGTQLARNEYLARLHIALADGAADVASRCVKSAFESAFSLARTLTAQSPQESFENHVDLDQIELPSTSAPCEELTAPVHWTQPRPLRSRKNYCVRLPPIVDHPREREVDSGEDVLISQYKHFGYVPKSIRRNFDKWCSLLKDVSISEQNLKALRREFPTLRTDALHCALVADDDNLQIVSSKLRSDPKYVQELLVVVAVVDVRSLIDKKTCKSNPSIRKQSSQSFTMKTLSSLESQSRHRAGIASEIQALLVDPSRECLQSPCSHKAALIRGKYLRTVKSPIDLGTRSRRRRFCK